VQGYDTPLQLWKLKLQDLAYTLRARRVLPPADITVSNTFWLPALERRRTRGAIYAHVARYPRGQLRFYPRGTILQTVSSPIRDAILAEVPTRAKTISVIPYPLSAAYLVAPLAERSRVVLYAGRIHPEKGLTLLIDAFRQFHSTAAGGGWQLKLLGPYEAAQGGGGTEFRRQLLERARGLPCEIPGPEFSAERLVAAYQTAGVFAYPSLAERGETFGLAVLEAMAAGAAPLVSALACFQDFLVDGKNGRIFDHRCSDPIAALAGKLNELATEPTLLAGLRREAWSTAREYSLTTIADQFLRHFTALAAPETCNRKEIE
jgi:glycosyltransferase involved in cell wall biosynthesis